MGLFRCLFAFSLWCIAPYLHSATATDAEHQRVAERIADLGQALDLWFARRPPAKVGIDTEADEEYLEELFEQYLGFEDEQGPLVLDTYLNNQLCTRPPEQTLALIEAWSGRVWNSLEYEAIAAGEKQHLPLLRDWGAQPSLVMLYVQHYHEACPHQALHLLDYARRHPQHQLAGDRRLREARYALTRMGLQLKLGEDVNVPKLRKLVARVEQRLSSYFDVSDGTVLTAIDEVALARQSPIWLVDRMAAVPKVQATGYACGTAMYLGLIGDMTRSLLAPLWPNEVLLLENQGKQEAAGAWALADVFDARPQPGSGLDYDPEQVVWRTWGQQATRAALEQAAAGIERFERGDQVLGVIRLFGHEFLVESGSQERGSDQQQWLDAAQLQEQFRQSYAFKRLWGEDPVAAQ